VTASSISIERNAMLSLDPKATAAFERVFGTYLKQKKAAARATQLAQVPAAPPAPLFKREPKATKVQKAAWGSAVQHALTAPTESLDDEGVVSPHFVAALEAVGAEGLSASESALSHKLSARTAAMPIVDAVRGKGAGERVVVPTVADSADQADDDLLAASAKTRTHHAHGLVKQAALSQLQALQRQQQLQQAYTQQLAQPQYAQPQYAYPQQQYYAPQPAYIVHNGQTYAAVPNMPPQGPMLATAPSSDEYFGPEMGQSAVNQGKVPYQGAARLSGWVAPPSNSPYGQQQQPGQEAARRPPKYISLQQAALAQMRTLGLDQ